MPIKLTLQRNLFTSNKWSFKQEFYSQNSWETFDLPVIFGVAGVYQAFIPDDADVEEWKEKLKEKAFQEMQDSIENIMEQIEALGSVK